MAVINEDLVELKAIEWFKEIGYDYLLGYDIAPEEPAEERKNYRDVILVDRLRAAIQKLNPVLPPQAVELAVSDILNPNNPSLVSCNRDVHSLISKGVQVDYQDGNEEIGVKAKVIDFADPENNDWLVVNQFTVVGEKERRPDVVVFVNGIPLVVLELKNAASEDADIWAAFNQLETYRNDIPKLFEYNAFQVISDGIYARMGSITADTERFMRWRTVEGETTDPLGEHREFETLVRGIFDKRRFLDYVRYCCLFEFEDKLIKKIAGYHQFHAVQSALESVVSASATSGDGRGGVVWHTQGAGKSIEMACLAGRIISDPRLENPTIVMVTDRQDLDGQLFSVFANAGDLLGESPKQADSREELRELLMNRPSGGIIFTTIQKFGLQNEEEAFPLLTDRRNVVVICDEAHRTQYGFKGRVDQKTGAIKYGMARHLRDGLPNATFLAFTGTPISEADRDTQAVFGSYISVYDIKQAVDDGATVPIYYESRLAKLELDQALAGQISDLAEEALEDALDEESERERAKTKWSTLEAVAGSEPRLRQIAEDLIEHYESRQETQPGKAMIVCMSREICARLYNQLIELRPNWHDEDHMKGVIKVVMTTSASDEQLLQPHHTNKPQKKDLEKRFKDPSDPLQIVLVRDMWLTGFDAPCLTTMYIDKPMEGANLAQAIARVNRVFKDKPGGLLVDYIGIAPQLKNALATYSASNGTGKPTLDVDEAFRIFGEKFEVACDLLHPTDWSDFRKNALEILPEALDHLLGLEDGKKRYCDAVLAITKAFALCGVLDKALEKRDEVAFLQAIRALLIKGDTKPPSDKDINHELRQLVSEAVISTGIDNVFDLAGLDRPDISVLSEDFLEKISEDVPKNLAVELLERLLRDEIKSKFRTNTVKTRKFGDLLEKSLAKYANRSIEAAKVIEELIAMAKAFQADLDLMQRMELDESEQAFYDALAQNESAQELLGEAVLVEIAKEISKKLRANLTVDWDVKEAVRAKLRLMVKTLLKRYKYPPDRASDAVEEVLQQAELVAEGWS